MRTTSTINYRLYLGKKKKNSTVAQQRSDFSLSLSLALRLSRVAHKDDSTPAAVTMITHFAGRAGPLHARRDEQLARECFAVRTKEDEATRLRRLPALRQQQGEDAAESEQYALHLHYRE